MPLPLGIIDVFCKVIDNFGDAGVSWRLSQQLTEQGWQVRLWIDDLACLQRLLPSLDTHLTQQTIQQTAICQWSDVWQAPVGDSPPQVVLEMFACDAPVAYHVWVQQNAPKAQWVIVEYLSAEDWVHSFHRQISRHSSGITKTYFFPGFTQHTGGLFYEPELAIRQTEWLSQHPHWLSESLGVPRDLLQTYLPTSLFCYSSAPIDVLKQFPLLLLLPDSIFPTLNNGAWGRAWIHRIPFLSPTDYDYLLWSCDLNFVRGEDSFLRAHWAGKPFIWQIYPQDENAHITKLTAWLARCQFSAPIQDWHYLWNNSANLSSPSSLEDAAFWQQWQLETQELRKTLLQQRSFVSNLCAWLENKVE